MTHEVLMRTARLWVDTTGIVQKRLLPGANETLEDALETIDAIKRVSATGEAALLVDIRPIRNIDRAARRFYASSRAQQHIRALALLVDSPVSRVCGNFFLGLNKPPYPAEIFDQESEAKAWLQEQTK